jgi:hypothetical protein
MAQESPGLKDAALMYEAVLSVLLDADLHVATASLAPEQAREKTKCAWKPAPCRCYLTFVADKTPQKMITQS